MCHPKIKFLVLAFFMISCNNAKEVQLTPEQQNIITAQALNNKAMDLHSESSGASSANEQIINLLDSAIKLNPDYTTAYWNKIVLYSKINDYEHLLKVNEQLMHLQPTPERIILQAVIYDLKGEPLKAKPLYEKGLAKWNTLANGIPKGQWEARTLIQYAEFNSFAGLKRESDSALQKLHEFPYDKAFKNYKLPTKTEWLDWLSFNRDGTKYEEEFERINADKIR